MTYEQILSMVAHNRSASRALREALELSTEEREDSLRDEGMKEDAAHKQALAQAREELAALINRQLNSPAPFNPSEHFSTTGYATAWSVAEAVRTTSASATPRP